MTTLPFWQQAAIIAICALATMTTRFLPFLAFTPGRELPAFVKYLGKALPSALFAFLVVYCMKDISFTEGNHGLPEIIATIATTALHVWKRQMMLSMAAGTLVYMVLVQGVF